VSYQENLLAVMRGLQEAAQTRGWCLVEGPAGSGKTPAVQAALRQLGWEAVWMGAADLSEAPRPHAEPASAPVETLVVDGLVDEWAPDPDHPRPERGWTGLYAALDLAMERSRHGLLTVLCVTCREGAEHFDRSQLAGCVPIRLT
jgi:hypothetical protein